MSKFTIAKKSCKCFQCGAEIKEGEKAQWFEKISTGHGEWSGKAYDRTMWKLICVSGCGERLYAKEQADKAVKEQQDAQFLVDQLRSMNISQENIDNMVDYYTTKGIQVK